LENKTWLFNLKGVPGPPSPVGSRFVERVPMKEKTRKKRIITGHHGGMLSQLWGGPFNKVNNGLYTSLRPGQHKLREEERDFRAEAEGGRAHISSMSKNRPGKGGEQKKRLDAWLTREREAREVKRQLTSTN